MFRVGQKDGAFLSYILHVGPKISRFREGTSPVSPNVENHFKEPDITLNTKIAVSA